jgi:hypothetical protein
MEYAIRLLRRGDKIKNKNGMRCRERDEGE